MTIQELGEVINSILKWIGLFGGAIAVVYTWVVKPWQTKKQTVCERQLEKEKQTHEKLEMVEKSLFYIFQALLYSRCMRIIERGSADLQEKQILTGLHESYEKIGGNGVLHQLYDEAMAVKTT